MRSLALIVLFAAVPLRAQEAADKAVSKKNVVRMNRVPISKEVLRVRLPRPVEKKLSNGLTVLFLEHHRLPKVELSLWIKTGDLSDPKDRPGLAQFTAEMLREGTAKRASSEIASEIEELGAGLGASSEFGANVTEVSASGLAMDAAAIFDLVADVALRPAFPDAELAKYKVRKLSFLEEERANPEFLAEETFQRAMYGGFPASVIAPTPDSIQRATREELKAFHDRHFVPENAMLGIAGDVKPEEAFALAEKHFGSWKGAASPAPSFGTVPPAAAARVLLVDRPGSVQANLVAGNLAIRRTDPDFVALVVANKVLGGGPSARLFLNLREEKGYTYGAYSAVTPNIYPGLWRAETEVRNAVVDGALHELMAEFRRLREERVPAAELDEVRQAIVARFALSLENPAGLLDRWLQTRYYGLAEDYWDRYPELVAKVDAETVQRVARRYLDLEHLQLVCVGDAKQIGDAVKKYGPVEIYDADGRPAKKP